MCMWRSWPNDERPPMIRAQGPYVMFLNFRTNGMLALRILRSARDLPDQFGATND
jgi:hypothetical protein